MTQHEGINCDLEEMSHLLKAIAHPVRLCIVKNLSKRTSANVNTMQDCLQVSQSSVSQHLAKLKAAGIVSSQREGKEIYYQICDKRIKELVTILFKDLD